MLINLLAHLLDFLIGFAPIFVMLAYIRIVDNKVSRLEKEVERCQYFFNQMIIQISRLNRESDNQDSDYQDM